MNRRGVLAATILGSSLAFIDGTVVNVALSALQRGLGASLADVQWVIEAYTLPFSALLLVGGSLGDRFGRRLVYAIGISIFTGASVACGLSGNVSALVAARAVQGLGAALLVPGSLAIIAASFPEDERGRAIGTWSGWSAMTTALGPVTGGWLIDHFSWRWAFFLNLPLALATLFLLFRCVPESRDPNAPRKLDVAGAALVTVGLGGIVYALIESPRRGFGHVEVLTSLLLGVAALVAFVRVEALCPSPMLPPFLFRSRAFMGTNLVTVGVYGAAAVVFFLLPLDLIQVQGYSATAAGAASLPIIAILFLLSGWSGGLVDRFGARAPLIAGPLVAAAGYALLAFSGVGGRYVTSFLPGLLGLGFGMALTVAPLTTTVMNAVDVGHAGLASGVNNAVSRAAGLVAIAAISLPLARVFEDGLGDRLRGLGLRHELASLVLAQSAKLGDAEIPPSADERERDAIRRAIGEAFAAGFRVVALAAAGLVAASAVTAAVTLEARSRGSGGSKAEAP
jgi:EmrB/QacA subfamily drug resistance transporter